MGGSPAPFAARPVEHVAKLLAAIRQVESAGNDRAVGDGGRSRGPYQIQAAYWADGGGRPERYLKDVWNARACERVIVGYWSRHSPAALAAGDWETLARVHNGGPAGAGRRATLGYWARVKDAMTCHGDGSRQNAVTPEAERRSRKERR
jgi:hypothetical protein